MTDLESPRGNEVPGESEVRQQLLRITESADFDTAIRAREFLRFVVERTISGRSSEISQYAIATSVFGRGDDFDPSTDPIVRMQAGRVRRGLERYYLKAGARDRVLVSLPKGTYVPIFRLREIARESPSWEAPSESAATPRLAAPWPTLSMAPFRNLTGSPGVDALAVGLAADLAAELDGYRHVHVFLGPVFSGPTEAPWPEDSSVASESIARFRLEGELAEADDSLKITTRLRDGATNRQIWSHCFRCGQSGATACASLEEIAQSVAASIAEENGVIARHLAPQTRRRRTTDLRAYEALLLCHRFDTVCTEEALRAALTALRNAVESDPDCGLCWAALARTYGGNWAQEISDEATPIEDALQYAQTSVRLDPTDQRTRTVSSYVRLLSDDVEEAWREADAALSLNPGGLFFLDGVGYVLTLSGDWDRGPDLIRRALRLNPFHREVVHAALWLDGIRRQDYEESYRQAQEFTLHGSFWAPLMRLTALAHLGRRDEAALALADLLQMKPDIRSRGRWLISRYVKFEELIERIEEALTSVGLRLA